jgi:hypothetical protein
MSNVITIYAELTLAGDLGNVGALGSTSIDATAETALDGDHKSGTQDVTTTATAIDTGAVDVTKAYAVLIINQAPASATNHVRVMAHDGTNSIEVGRLYPGGPGRFVTIAPPQVSGWPKLRLQTDSGTAKAAVKVFELGVPETGV